MTIIAVFAGLAAMVAILRLAHSAAALVTRQPEGPVQ